MGDEESKDSLKKNFIWKLICKIFNVGHVLQPIWFRHYSILTGKVNREFVERKFNFVFYMFKIKIYLEIFSIDVVEKSNIGCDTHAYISMDR